MRKTGKKEELVARLCDALSNAEQPAEKTNFSKAEVLKMLDLPEMHSLLRQKRLRWVGHALRRKDGDLSKDTVKQELARKSSTWTACVLSDMEALNIGGVVALEREANNRESFRKLTSILRNDVKRKREVLVLPNQRAPASLTTTATSTTAQSIRHKRTLLPKGICVVGITPRRSSCS